MLRNPFTYDWTHFLFSFVIVALTTKWMIQRHQRKNLYLKNKIKEKSHVVVVGASSGIGKSLALEFAKRNCHLTLIARRKQELEKVVQECQEIYKQKYCDRQYSKYQKHDHDGARGNIAQKSEYQESMSVDADLLPGIQIVVADIALEKDIERMFHETMHAPFLNPPRIDVLVLNAGVIHEKTFEEMCATSFFAESVTNSANASATSPSSNVAAATHHTHSTALHPEQKQKGNNSNSLEINLATQVMEKMFRVNVFGYILTTKHFLKSLIESKGKILVIGSLGGVIGAPTRTLYVASKHALQGFFNSLRLELESKGVFICISLPATVDTDIRKTALDSTSTCSSSSSSSSTNTTRMNSHHNKIQEKKKSKMLSSMECAQATLNGFEHGETHVFVPKWTKLAYILNSFFPTWIGKMSKKKYGFN